MAATPGAPALPAMFARYRDRVEQELFRSVPDGEDAVLKATRYQIKHGAKVIKICATAGVLSWEELVGAQQFSEAEMRVIVEEASRHGVAVAQVLATMTRKAIAATTSI